MIRTMIAALGAAVLATGAFGQDEEASAAETREPRIFESTGQITANGTRVRYSVTAGETFLRDEDGNPTASIFSTTYIADGTADPRTRPVAFIFNGGPGSASLWLHMGMFGPQRLVLPNAMDDGAAPYEIGRECLFHSRRRRPRLRGSGRHGLEPRPRRHRGQRILGRQRGRRKPGPVHPHLADRTSPLEFAQIPAGRELRHAAHRRPAEPARGQLQRCRDQWRRPDLDRARLPL